MKKRRLGKLVIALAFSLISSNLLLNEVEVKAAETNEDNPPSHIKLDGIFQTPSASNSIIIADPIGDIVQITDAVDDETGAVWSRANNKMDLTKDFESSMYIYFGNQGTKAADGMAFVMQNDSRDGDTILTDAEGGSLGVWDSTEDGIWGKGVNNSLAIEFDTHNNDDFDDPVRNDDHIAWNYPGKRGSYEDSWFKRKLAHKDPQYPGELSSDQWYPFSIKWQAATSQLTYQFAELAPVTITINDIQDIFGSTNVNWGFTGSTGSDNEMNRVAFASVPGLVNGTVTEQITNQKGENINGSIVAGGEKLTHKITGNYLSGKQDWMNIIAKTVINDSVDYVPGSLAIEKQDGTRLSLSDDSFTDQALVTDELEDITEENSSSSILFDVRTKEVYADTLVAESASFEGQNYIATSNQVNYKIVANQAPQLTLENEQSQQKINTESDYEVKGTWLDPDGTELKLMYLLNGSEWLSQDLTNSAVNRASPYSAVIPASQLRLGENTIEVYGVDADNAESQYLKTTVLVQGPPNVLLNGANTTVKLENGSDYLLSGKWQDVDSDWNDLYYSLDRQVAVKFASQVANPDKGQPIDYQFLLPVTELPIGTHELSVYTIDTEGLKSNVEQLQLNVAGNLSFTNVSEQVSYQTTKIPQQVTSAKRNTDWNIRVLDTRGAGSSWHVNVILQEQFTNQEKNKLSQGLAYVDQNNQTTKLEVGIATTVFSKTTNDNAEVAVNWSENQGLLLNIDPSDYAGSYQGVLNWSLVDGPQ